MAVYYPGCPESITAPSCSDCPTKELGDIRSFFLVKSDFTFTDISATAEWTTGIMSKDIYVFPYTRGSLDVAETTSVGFGDSEIELDGYAYTLNVVEPEYIANANFWNDIKNSNNWKIGFRTETQVHLSDVVGTVVPKQPIAEDKKAGVFWNIMATFSQDSLLIPNTKPTGVFEQCIQPA